MIRTRWPGTALPGRASVKVEGPKGFKTNRGGGIGGIAFER